MTVIGKESSVNIPDHFDAFDAVNEEEKSACRHVFIVVVIMTRHSIRVFSFSRELETVN
jgi:hypothetical protein